MLPLLPLLELLRDGILDTRPGRRALAACSQASWMSAPPALAQLARKAAPGLDLLIATKTISVMLTNAQSLVSLSTDCLALMLTAGLGTSDNFTYFGTVLLCRMNGYDNVLFIITYL
jgi:hypothetical protein